MSDLAPGRLHDRIRWNCRRGMLELDLVLNAFVERHLDGLDATELEVFQAVLAYPDPMLLAVVMGQAEPEDAAERGIVTRLRAVQASQAA